MHAPLQAAVKHSPCHTESLCHPQRQQHVNAHSLPAKPSCLPLQANGKLNFQNSLWTCPLRPSLACKYLSGYPPLLRTLSVCASCAASCSTALDWPRSGLGSARAYPHQSTRSPTLTLAAEAQAEGPPETAPPQSSPPKEEQREDDEERPLAMLHSEPIIFRSAAPPQKKGPKSQLRPAPKGSHSSADQARHRVWCGCVCEHFGGSSFCSSAGGVVGDMHDRSVAEEGPGVSAPACTQGLTRRQTRCGPGFDFFPFSGGLAGLVGHGVWWCENCGLGFRT